MYIQMPYSQIVYGIARFDMDEQLIDEALQQWNNEPVVNRTKYDNRLEALKAKDPQFYQYLYHYLLDNAPDIDIEWDDQGYDSLEWDIDDKESFDWDR